MSKTEANSWKTVNVVSIPPGIEVVIKGEGKDDGAEIVLPAIAILHQTLFGAENVTERIVLGVLDVNNGQIMAVEPEQVAGVDASHDGRRATGTG